MDVAKIQISTAGRPGGIPFDAAENRRSMMIKADLRLLSTAWQLQQRLEELSCKLNQLQASRSRR